MSETIEERGSSPTTTVIERLCTEEREREREREGEGVAQFCYVVGKPSSRCLIVLEPVFSGEGNGVLPQILWREVFFEIAIKRLKVWSAKAELEFAVEVEVLGRVKHNNLLSLRGYCAEGQERLIVYDFMPNLSLMSHLHGQNSAECLLDWDKRMKIAIGSAEGIAYLHHFTPHIIHRDVKASNVLLDSDFHSRVADFGFAKLIPDGASHVTTRVKGTLGYLAPEYAMFGKASESCDVYSFGILLVEIVSGKKPIEKVTTTVKRSIVQWALPLVCERRYKEVADPKLGGKYNVEELKRVVLVGLLCAQEKPDKRPTMPEVVELLKGDHKEKVSKLEKDDLFNPDKSGIPDMDMSTESISDETSSTDLVKGGTMLRVQS